MALHCSATYLLIRVAKNVLPKNRTRVGSLITGALFAVHPVHTEAVASVVGKKNMVNNIASNKSFYCLSVHSDKIHYSQKL